MAALNGCAATDVFDLSIYGGKGVYHTVEKGETLWSISKKYDVSITDIIRANRLTDVSLVKENQRLFIPGAEQLKEAAVIQSDNNKDEFAWPLNGQIVNWFGQKRWGYFDKGISIKADQGSTVKAARQGRVVFADYLSGYAMTVIIDHNDGYFSIYSQNAELLVKSGDNILKGDAIAKLGRSGQSPYLYFQICRGAVADNPLYYLPKL